MAPEERRVAPRCLPGSARVPSGCLGLPGSARVAPGWRQGAVGIVLNRPCMIIPVFTSKSPGNGI